MKAPEIRIEKADRTRLVVYSQDSPKAGRRLTQVKAKRQATAPRKNINQPAHNVFSYLASNAIAL